MWFIPAVALPLACFAFVVKRAHHAPDQPRKDANGNPFFIDENWQKQKYQPRKLVGLSLAIPVKDLPVFEIKPENWLTRSLKAMKLCNEYRTGDTSFDDRVFIACDSASFSEKLGLRAEARGAIQSLLDMGAREIVSNDGFLWASMEKSPDAILRDPQKIFQILEILRGLAKSAGAPSSMMVETTPANPLFWHAVIASAVSLGLATAGLLGWLDIIFFEHYRVLGSDLARDFSIIGAGAGVLWVVVNLIYFSESSWGPMVLPLAFFAGLSGATMDTMLGAYYVNTVLDDTPAHTEQVSVTERYTSRGRRSVTQHIRTTPAMDGAYGEVVAKTGALFGQVSEGTAINVTFGSGRLGYAWVKDEDLAFH